VVSEQAVGWDPTISAVPAGATLDVKASVSADRRYVQMDLRPQQIALGTPPFRFVTIQAASSAVVAATTIELPQIIVQDYKTTVSVPDGGTLLLGGTRKYTETEAETGVPVLSKIPILKRLFNNRASLRSAKNLLVLIRPKIIIQSEEEDKLGYDDF
jgi:type II secretory pathway component GspD/PulD (secretin)